MYGIHINGKQSLEQETELAIAVLISTPKCAATIWESIESVYLDSSRTKGVKVTCVSHIAAPAVRSSARREGQSQRCCQICFYCKLIRCKNKSVTRFNFLSLCLSVCLCVCVCLSVSVCLSVCLSVSVSLSLCLSLLHTYFTGVFTFRARIKPHGMTAKKWLCHNRLADIAESTSRYDWKTSDFVNRFADIAGWMNKQVWLQDKWLCEPARGHSWLDEQAGMTAKQASL